MLSSNNTVSALFKRRFPADTAEGMALPQRIILPPETICMDWQQRQRPGAGLFNLGNTCYINVILQCLTHTPPLANYLLSYEHSQSCEYFQEHLVNLLGTSQGFPEPAIRFRRTAALLCQPHGLMFFEHQLKDACPIKVHSSSEEHLFLAPSFYPCKLNSLGLSHRTPLPI